MSNVVAKKFSGHDVMYIVESMLALEGNEQKIKAMPVKLGWLLSRNKDTLINKYNELNQMRQKELTELQQRYFYDEEMSYEIQIPRTDENGENILDEDGNPIMEEGRRLKEEYFKEYQECLNDLNQLLLEEGNKVDEYFILTYDLDNFFENYEGDTLTFVDIEFMKFMNEK